MSANLKPKAPIGVFNSIIAKPEVDQPNEVLGNDDLARNAAQVAAKNAGNVPTHYDKPVQPWDLVRCMDSSGNAFVDHMRGNAIKYAFRNKDDLKADLIKAKHCLEAAIAQL
jgi:hypothetical protein